MSLELVQRAIRQFFEGIDADGGIQDATQISQLFNTLDETGIKILEKVELNSLKRLLFILLKIISLASVQNAFAACDRFLLYLKKIPAIFDLFNPKPDILREMNFKRILTSTQSEIVFDLMIFIMRYYTVDYDHFELGPELKEVLIREEKKRVWLTLDHVLIKLDSFLEEFKKRNLMTANAIGEIFSYMEEVKKNTNQSRVQRSLDVEPQNNPNHLAMSMQDMEGPSRFAEKQDLDALKREINQLKENLTKSSKEPSPIGFFKEKESRQLEDKLTDVPRAYLADAITGEVANLKQKMSKMQVSLEAIEKTTNKLADDKHTKFTQLEKKVADDLESFRLFKERVQIEVDTLKERAGNLKTSVAFHSAGGEHSPERGGNPNASGFPAQGEESLVAAQNREISNLSKIHDAFKKDTLLNLSKLNAFMNAVTKKLGINSANANVTGSESVELNDNPGPAKEKAVLKDRSFDTKKGGAGGLSAEEAGRIESKVREMEVELRRQTLEIKKDYLERFELVENSLKEMKGGQCKHWYNAF